MTRSRRIRPVEAVLYDSIPEDHRPSARAIVVLVFWSYFSAKVLADSSRIANGDRHALD